MKPSLFLCRKSTVHIPFVLQLAIALVILSLPAHAEELVQGRRSLVLENPAARVVIDLGGGSIGEFRLRDSEMNPLTWSAPSPGDSTIHGFGHFLCLDRWGPPSQAEGAKGMPYHGEAANVAWRVVRDPAVQGGAIEAEISAQLPKAGLSVRRTVRMAPTAALFTVREEVTNQNPLGRIFNLVQHPTIAPPFLDESTLVDCNGRKGFAQGGDLPTPEEPSFFWPQARNEEGEAVNLRRMTNSAEPSVVSYSIDGQFGWITAATPAKGLLIGYLWLSKDYPWVSLWRDVHQGRPAARGLEFGTTGLHQPFSILVKKGRIWDRPLFEYLDSGETMAKRFTAFLLRIPTDFAGVQSLEVDQGKIVLHERGPTTRREFRIEAEGLVPN